MMPQNAVLNITLFGQVALAAGGREVRLRSRKAWAVLGYLALTEGLRDSRESIAGLLWGDSGERQARASLRQIIKELRAALDPAGDAVALDQPVLALAAGRVRTDVWDVQEAARAGRAHPLLLQNPRLAETLLKGLEDVDDAFRGWLLPRRQTLHDLLLRDLEKAMRHEAAPAQQADLAMAVLNLDPTHEEACRSLMRLRARAGDSAGAQRLYETMARHLDAEFDTDPAEETTALYAAIKAGDLLSVLRDAAAEPLVAQGVRNALVSRTGDPVAAEPPTRLALLLEPFAMNGVDTDQIHLVEGFRHSLTASLVRFREWSVVDALQARGESLSQGYAIAATAYRAGDAISTMLTLRDIAAGVYIWSDSFVLSLDSWFEAQQRLVRRIAMSLNVQLSAQRLMQLEGRPDVALDIHDRWLRGQALARRFGADNWNRAVQLYEDAIRDAPGYSPAYSSLVQMNNVVHMANPGLRRDMARAETTLALARRAVVLDPLDSRAQLALGWALAMMDRQALAVAPMNLACALNPYDSWTLISAALFHAYHGNPARARELAAESMGMTLTPTLMQWAYEGTIRFVEGDYAVAVDATEMAQDVIPTLPAWRAAALHHLGHASAAAREARRFVELVRARWAAATPATEEAIGHWLLHQYPITRGSDWERLRDGIAGAGIPVGAAAHGAWWGPPPPGPPSLTCSA